MLLSLITLCSSGLKPLLMFSAFQGSSFMFVLSLAKRAELDLPLLATDLLVSIIPRHSAKHKRFLTLQEAEAFLGPVKVSDVKLDDISVDDLNFDGLTIHDCLLD